MSASSTMLADGTWQLPSRGRIGMWCLILAEAAIFTLFLVAYIFYIGKSLSGPQPRDVLHPPIVYTVCLLSSSVTIHLAVRELGRGSAMGFGSWWLLTIFLGGAFMVGTAREWIHLIRDEGLTISTNLFGTTYYSLVGLHAFHVTVGLIALTVVAVLYFVSHLRREHSERLEILSMYWHFVDAVWAAVFLVVYVIGV
jgi:cytochrome c oxidase subunit III